MARRKRNRRKNTAQSALDPSSPAGKYAAFKEKQAFNSSEVGRFATRYPFDLDHFQICACQALVDGMDVLVGAPTSSGKTIVAEFAVDKALREGSKLFYTTPIKALSNQKFHDLAYRFGQENLGLLTGDTTINPNAPIIVMTTEVARNMIYSHGAALENLGYVVMDEVHYLADKFRGPVWEEVLINLDPDVRVISLSATVSNVEDFGNWLSSVRRRTKVVISETRPVPLEQKMFIEGEIVALHRPGSNKLNPRLYALAQATRGQKRFRMPRRPRLDRPGVCQALVNDNMLPAIFFVFSRAGCEQAVQEVVDSGMCFTTDQQATRIEQLAHLALSDLSDAEFALVGGPQWVHGLTLGVAAHHAGLLPVMKELVERLFIQGLLRVVFATETLALGVNMPARTVIIEQLDKWNGSEHAPLTAGEYTQLTGRAGRRGIDSLGYAVTLLSEQTPPYMVASLASKRSYPLHSAFVPTYNMTVNLLAYLDLTRARNNIEKSFAQWEAEHAVRKIAAKARQAREKAQQKLSGAVCERGDVMELERLMRELSTLEKQARARRFSAHNTEQSQHDDRVAIEQARARMKAHPVYSCPERELHLVVARSAYQTMLKADNLEKQISLRTTSLSSQFDRVVQVLKELGYLQQDATLTQRGELLRSIYGEKDLLISQCLHDGVWNSLTTAQLAAVLAAVVYIARSDTASPVVPGGASAPLAQALRQMNSLNARLQDIERHHHLSQGRPLDTGLSVGMEVWARGKSLNQALENAQMSAGDFVRWARQVVDLADQLSNCVPNAQLGVRLRQVVNAVRRGVVAWQY